MTIDEEDDIIRQANDIKQKYFKQAEEEWAKTPLVDKTRPWPRCKSLQCNRTLVCTFNRCQGFDF